MLRAHALVVAVCLYCAVPAFGLQDKGGELVTLRDAACPDRPKPLGIAGKVKVKATTGTDGRMHDVKAVSGPKELWPAAVDLVSCEIREPYIHNGKAVEVKTTVSVVFTKEDKTATAAPEKTQNAASGGAASSN